MYKYFHDPSSKTVYRCRSDPQVTELKFRGRLSGWQVSLDTDVTRADNWLASSSQWHFPVLELRQQEFEFPRYSREQAVSWFLQRHSPAQWNTIEIDEPTFDALESEYKAQALKNKRHV